jgi:N-methylhydantoinase B
VVPASGAAGSAPRRVWRVLGHEAHAAVCCERSLARPFGLAGGRLGAPMRLWLELPDGTRRALNSKGAFRVPAEGRRDGGAGLGATARPPPATRCGCRRTSPTVTEEGARRDYGIAD